MSELTKKFNILDNNLSIQNKISKKALFLTLFICFILDSIESRVKILSPPELKNIFGGI
jgi:hypothetical protein